MTYIDDDMMADLAVVDDEFAAVEPAERTGGGGNNVPDGTYQARIEKLYFDRAKRDQTKILLKWELVVAVGEYEGETLYRNNMTTTQDNLRWLKADLLAAGLNTDGMRLTDVAGKLDDLLDVLLEVRVKRVGSGDDERVNVYINRCVDRDEPADRKPATRNAPPARRETREPARTSERQGGSSRGLSRF